MELNFIKCGDYYIPDIKVKNPNIRLGKWGRMRKEYLRLANPVLFSDMVLNETLYEHCAEIEETAKKRTKRDSIFHLMNNIKKLTDTGWLDRCDCLI